MIDYTIMEYNFETKQYKTIGIAEGIDGNQAKKENKYRSRYEYQTKATGSARRQQRLQKTV